MQTFKDMLNLNAQKFANKTALVFEDKRLTFAQVNARINRLNHALSSLGVVKGDRVGIFAYNCSQYFEVFGVSKAGRICVPLNFRSVGREILYQVNHSELNTLIVEKEFVPVVNSIRAELTTVRNFICLDADVPDMLNYETLLDRASADEPTESVAPEDPCVLYYTSGTTGRPKGAMHTHKSMIAEAHIPYREICSDDVALCVMPFFHVGGSAAHMIPAFAVGATIVIQKKFDETLVLETLEKERMSYIYLVPAMIIRVLEHPNLNKYDLSSLRTLAFTGAPMPLEAYKKGIKRLGPIFIQFLGQTETLNLTVFQKKENRIDGSPKELKRLESCGKPFRDGEVRIVDEQGCDVPVGAVGEIVAKSDRIMQGYWKMPQETAETIRDGWLHTGDLARFDEDGYIYIVDRKKDMIISGGENIYSREVEEVLYMHPAVLEAAVIGVPDAQWGESVKALIVLKPGVTATEEEIISFCKDNLASYKKPRSVEFRVTLPKTPSGKIRKVELREAYWRDQTKRVH
ncbi:MAG: long-chain-fatty-acid--CoA ligase [Chloroflexi bacterium]|nr:long-chain-fatty-acid--CoA ligase [Chloroflexota bacterium]